MKFKIRKNVLDNALSFVETPLLSSGGDDIPDIVKNVFIVCEKEAVTFYGTNLKTMFSYSIKTEDIEKVLVETPGECLLLSKSVSKLVKKHSDDQWVTFDLKKGKNKEEANVVNIRVSKSSQKVLCAVKVDYPKDILTIKNESSNASIPASVYVEAVNNIFFACGKDSQRYDLFNICIEFNENSLFFVAGSGPNLAVYNANLSTPIVSGNNQFLINKDIIIRESKYFDMQNGYVNIIVGKNIKEKDIISFKHTNKDEVIQIFSNIINLDFPNWKGIYNIPPTDNKLSVAKKDFVDVLERILIVSPKSVSLQSLSESNIVNICSDDEESVANNNCHYEEEVETIYNSINDSKYFNTKLLSEGLKKILGDVIDLELYSSDERVSIIKAYSNSFPAYSYFLSALPGKANDDYEYSEEESEEEESEEI